MRFAKTVLFVAALALPTLASSGAASAGEAQNYKVELNKTEILRLPGSAASIIIGNPQIADVTVQSVDTLFVVGRGYGETNLIILDNNGQKLFDANLQVVNSLSKHGVRLYKATERETYSCLPYCGPSPVLGDASQFISENTATQQTLTPFTAFSNPNPNNGGQIGATDNTQLSGEPIAAGGPTANGEF